MSHHHDACCQASGQHHHEVHDTRQCSCSVNHVPCLEHACHNSHQGASASTPLEILDRRFAKGKIDAQEYQDRKTVLSVTK